LAAFFLVSGKPIGIGHEKNFPTKQSETRAHPRLSGAHGNAGWPQGHQGPPRQGPRASGALIPASVAGGGVSKPLGFPRSVRLTAASDYRYVFAEPRKAIDRNFVVLYRSGRESAARLGLAVTKKRLRRAVDRNRIKRLVRESFRHAREHLVNLDAVVLVRDGCASRSNAELRASLDRLWQKVASRHS